MIICSLRHGADQESRAFGSSPVITSRIAMAAWGKDFSPSTGTACLYAERPESGAKNLYAYLQYRHIGMLGRLVASWSETSSRRPNQH